MAAASACVRGTSVSSLQNSSSVCALPPTGPSPHKVGAPSAAVKPESAQPPVDSPSTGKPTYAAAPL